MKSKKRLRSELLSMIAVAVLLSIFLFQRGEISSLKSKILLGAILISIVNSIILVFSLVTYDKKQMLQKEGKDLD